MWCANFPTLFFKLSIEIGGFLSLHASGLFSAIAARLGAFSAYSSTSRDWVRRLRFKCFPTQACRFEPSPYIPPSQEKSTYLNSASFLKYSKPNQPMLFPSKISNHLSLINRTFSCLWDVTTQKISGRYNMKTLNSPTNDQETTYPLACQLHPTVIDKN